MRSEHLRDTERILQESHREKEKYFITLEGERFIVYPGVFSPKYFSDSEYFAEIVPLKKDSEFLEIGAGTGVIAILVALKGAKKVVATDINSLAIKNAKENVDRHRIADRVTVLKGDVFEPLSSDDKFDIIFWNFPFGYVEDETIDVERRALYDPHYAGLKKFIGGLRDHLKNNGRAFLGFSSDIGDFPKLKEICQDNNFEIKLFGSKIKKQGNPKGVIEDYKEIRYEIFELVPF